MIVGAAGRPVSMLDLLQRRPRCDGTDADEHPIFGGEAKQNEFEVDGYHLTARRASRVLWFRSIREGGGLSGSPM